LVSVVVDSVHDALSAVLPTSDVMSYKKYTVSSFCWEESVYEDEFIEDEEGLPNPDNFFDEE